jgi:hypothetical protein
MLSDDVSTQHLKARLATWRGEGTLTDWMLLTQAYHTSRLADAMERIASQLENSQISTLEGADIVNQLAIIAGRIH